MGPQERERERERGGGGGGRKKTKALEKFFMRQNLFLKTLLKH
jgi:hypothetical protein